MSEWLDALSHDMLNALDEYIEHALESEIRTRGVMSDMVNLCEIAFAAEKGGEIQFSTNSAIKKALRILQVIVALIAIRRVGYIQLLGPLALSSNDDFKFIITEAGRKLGIELGMQAK